jgi:hypothetical protein
MLRSTLRPAEEVTPRTDPSASWWIAVQSKAVELVVVKARRMFGMGVTNICSGLVLPVIFQLRISSMPA